MKRTISLDTNEINNLIEELNDYSSLLNDKVTIFLWRLASLGKKVIDSTYGDGWGDSSRDHKCEFQLDQDGNVSKMKILVSGEDILFVEFGAGIALNKGNTHPKAAELGYGVGTYPNQTHAFDPNGWYYRKNGALYHSFGTEATMPVYKASLEIISQMEEIAKEVFGG